MNREYWEEENLPAYVEWREIRVLVAYAAGTNKIVDEHLNSSAPVGFGHICANPHELDPHPDFRLDKSYIIGKELGYHEECPTCRGWEESERE